MSNNCIINVGFLGNYRRETFRAAPARRLQSAEEAVAFARQRAFIYFWPIKNINLPSLWAAVAGARPVADAHDDPGHITWRWKDQLLDQRQWYYAKILRGKATIIALEMAPTFYALSENYGDPEQDYLQLYEDGLLSREAKTIYEALLAGGPLDTVRLRRQIHMTARASNNPFERGLVALQRDFKILPVGVAETGAWRYSFIYEVVHRWYPELPEAARAISRSQARQKLVECYFESLGAAETRDVRLLFQWRPREIEQTLAKLVEQGRLRAGCRWPGREGEFYALPRMVVG